MKRRTLLAGVGATAIVLGSGCIDDIRGTSGSNSGGSGPSPPMSLSLIAVDAGPGPLSFEVTVMDARIGRSNVPLLDIAVTNTGDETARWAYTGQYSGLSFPHGVQSMSGGLLLGLEDEVRSQLVDAERGCLRVGSFISEDGSQNTVLASNERVVDSYAIAGDTAMGGICPEPGEYRIEHELGELGTWGFEFQMND